MPNLNQKIYPVILCGGSGTRLWPLSRKSHPKQFLALSGDKSFLQKTLIRLSGAGFEKPLIVSNEQFRFLIAEQCREVNVELSGLLLEPCPRNTAPAIACAALWVNKIDPDALLMVLPSDHEIINVEQFIEAVFLGVDAASRNEIVTFGVKPTAPEIGYGYIRKGSELNNYSPGVFRASGFFEKPCLAKAEEMFADGKHYWNSGMFLFSTETILQGFMEHEPDLLKYCKESLNQPQTDSDFFRITDKYFSQCRSVSIDLAIVEHIQNKAVVPVDMGWSDVGSWEALWKIGDKDENENMVRGDCILIESSGCIAHNHKGQLIAAVGMNDTIIISTDDAILIAPRERSQDVKEIVSSLKQSGRKEYENNTHEYRPWGSFHAITQGSRYQVKKLKIKPGGQISLQKHYHRSEHWIVVRGTAEIILGGQKKMLHENESVYIPAGEIHRLSNPGFIDLELIEVQVGSYLGEDDILRLDDIYARSSSF